MPKTLTPPEVEREIDRQAEPPAPGGGGLFNVVLLNDDDHTYDYVIEMLQRLFLCPAEQAMRHASEVDTTGRTVVLTCPKPEAEFGRDQILAYGPDPRMESSHGSMSAVVEPA